MAACLNTLPREILALICAKIECGQEPCALKNFSQTCRNIREISQELLLAHRYSEVRDKNDDSIARILKDVLTIPGIASYVKKLSVYNHYCGVHDEDDVPDDFEDEKFSEASQAFITENLPLYIDAVTQAIPEHLQESWIEGIRNFNNDPLVALLILNCPSLEIFDWDYHDTTEYEDSDRDLKFYFFEYLRETCRLGLKPKTALKEVKLHKFMAYDSGNVMDGEDAATLLTIPSLETLDIKDASSSEYNDYSSNIYHGGLKSLSLLGCCFDAKGIESFSRGSLQNLSCNIVGVCGNYNGSPQLPKEIVLGIERATSQTLKSLRLFGGDGSYGEIETDSDLPTFCSFPRLSHLELNDNIFPHIFHLQRRNQRWVPIELRQPPLDQPDIGPLMPPNLQVLEIPDGSDPQTSSSISATVVDKLLNLLSTKYRDTALLKRIVLRRQDGTQVNKLAEEKRLLLEEKCREVDVELVYETHSYCKGVGHIVERDVVVERAIQHV